MKIAGCTSPFENSLHGQITHCKCKHIIKRKKKQLPTSTRAFFAIVDER